MSDMTNDRWRRTCEYIDEVFGGEDAALDRLAASAAEAGLPDISINAATGRLLMILASMTRGRLALELGTLGGYSAAWITRGLAPGGRLITVEREPRHADFAEKAFESMGLIDRIALRRGDALEVLGRIPGELGGALFDFAFFDADKEQYPEYWRLVEPLIAPGGLIVMDNALGSSRWWIDEPGHPARDAADRVNRSIAAHPGFEAVAVPLRQGLLIARRKTEAP